MLAKAGSMAMTRPPDRIRRLGHPLATNKAPAISFSPLDPGHTIE